MKIIGTPPPLNLIGQGTDLVGLLLVTSARVSNFVIRTDYGIRQVFFFISDVF